MADQKRWFKLWHTILDDDDILSLEPADRWRWCALGAYIVAHGNRGAIRMSRTNTALASAFGCESSALFDALKRLPHVRIEEGKNEHGKITVSFSNWHKYQVDSTHTERQKRARFKRRGEEKRGEEKRKESSTPSPSSPEGAAEKPDSLPPKWGTPEALIALYNLEGADELSAVEVVSAGRLKKAREYLKAFPQQEFWLKVFQETKLSLLLRGLKPSKDHPNFKGDFDWLLTKGKDGTENCSKVWEEKYRDA